MDLNDQHKRPRRNRKNKAIRNWVRECSVEVDRLVQPIFLVEGKGVKEEIESLPGNFRFSTDLALNEVEECLRFGIRNFILFPAVEDEKKDTDATYGCDPENFYVKAISKIKEKYPEVCVITDVAMDPYSSDGHDGKVKNGKVLNDETLPILSKMALVQASAGADIIGPSDMMDGRVGYIRDQLDRNGFQEVSIMAYTAKYASAFYGPFRDALGSTPKAGDKKTYQMDPANKREAIIEAELDEMEGADQLMVKPALSYLDVIHVLKEETDLPVVAYNVSGECAMVKAASEKGWLDHDAVMEEILLSIRRAGADLIISYFSKEFAQQKLG